MVMVLQYQSLRELIPLFKHLCNICKDVCEEEAILKDDIYVDIL